MVYAYPSDSDGYAKAAMISLVQTGRPVCTNFKIISGGTKEWCS